MPFKVILVDNQLKRIGRPQFISSINKNIKVERGMQNRRHILHGATQISDVLIDSFNRIIQNHDIDGLAIYIDEILNKLKEQGVKFELSVMTDESYLVKKIEKIITLAFSLKQNLVVGSAIANQAIEKARISIRTIRQELDNYCVFPIRSDTEIKDKAMQLIAKKLVVSNSLNVNNKHEIASYRRWILKQLQKTIGEVEDTVSLIRLLHDFEFSCTLDIIHDGTTKEQNIWGIQTINELNLAIHDCNEKAIIKILFQIKDWQFSFFEE